MTKYHQDAMAKLEALKVAVNDPSASVANMLIKSQDELYKNNVKVVKSLMKGVLFCGLQGLALRGHQDDFQYQSGSGNIRHF